MSTSKKTSSDGSGNRKDNANGEGRQGNSERRDEDQKKATTELSNVQQQENSRSITSQEQSQPDKIPEMTGEEEKKMKYIRELETLRGRVKNLEEESKRVKELEGENKKFSEELSNKEKRIMQLQEEINRKLHGQKNIHLECQPKIGDEDQNKATTEGNNGQQQQNSQPNTSQDKGQSDTIPEMTGEEEKKMKYIRELETLRGRVKELEGENKKFSEELSNKEIRIMQLQEEINREMKGQKNIRLEDQPKVGRPDHPRSVQPLGQRHVRDGRPKSALPHGQHHVRIDPADLYKQIQEQDVQMRALMAQDRATREECARLSNENDALRVKVKKYETLLTSLKEEKNTTEKEILRLKKDKDELLNRLSKVASDKLTHENTDITDLSDENRPTKLAEKISELYDNQYTDAFDELKKNNLGDKDATQMLLKILMDTHQLCKEVTLNRYEKLKYASSCFEISSLTDDHDEKDTTIINDDLCIELQQDLKKIWRESSKPLLKKARPIIKERVAAQFDFPVLTMTQIHLYMKRCIDLCWMMNLQEKPMHLDVSMQETDGHTYFDREKFRSYTKTGQYVAFVVWPALYLFEGGALLKKGIAQGSSVAEG